MMNKIYQGLYPQKLFNLQEANKIIKDYQVCKNNINRLVRQKLITTLKPGLYHINPLDNKDFYPDPIHIGSKLRPNAVICANSALRVLKLRTQDENTVYISSKHHAKLRIDNHTYKIIKDHNFGIDKIDYETPYGTFEIKVTDPERTILDCLKTRSIKSEELVNILRTRPLSLNFRKISNYLEKYNTPILYNKAGLILELCKGNLKIDEDDLEKIRKRLTRKIYYFKERGIKLVRPKYHYNKEWNIMLPDHLFELTKILKPQTVQ
jgi:predicted transcriptional regulator of viral defense system